MLKNNTGTGVLLGEYQWNKDTIDTKNGTQKLYDLDGNLIDMNPLLNSIDLQDLNEEEKLINSVLFERKRSDKNILAFDD